MTSWSEHREEFSSAAPCDRAARKEAGADVPDDVTTAQGPEHVEDLLEVIEHRGSDVLGARE